MYGDSKQDLNAVDSADVASRRRFDWPFFLASLATAIIVTTLVFRTTFGLSPVQNSLFASDTERVMSNLLGTSQDYYRIKVHPLTGWLFVVFQYIIRGLFHLPVAVGVVAMCLCIGMLAAGLLYLLLRRIGVSPLSAFAFTALFCSTGSFITWSTIPESHLPGGVSTVVATLLLLPRQEGSTISPLRRGLAFTAASSMVVTDVAVWFLAQLDLERLGIEPLRQWIGEQWALARNRAFALAMGLGATILLWALQWPLLYKRLGIPFNFLEERAYLNLSPASPIWTLETPGYLYPGGVSSLIGAVAIVLTGATMLVLPRRLWFIPLFVLFGVALHVVYSGVSAFLFAPNYTPLSIAAVGFCAVRLAPKWAWIGALVLAVGLGFYNLDALTRTFSGLAAEGKLIAD